MLRTHFFLLLCIAPAAVLASPGMRDHRPPEDFLGLEEVDPMIERVLVTAPVEARVDLESGFRARDCAVGLAEGSLHVRDGERYLFTYRGELWGCYPFGRGRIEYADGTRYEGLVNSFFRGAAVSDVMRDDRVFIAVPHGQGRFLNQRGEWRELLFERGARERSGRPGPGLARFLRRAQEIAAARDAERGRTAADAPRR